jgi:hypothetical protein
MKNAWVRSALWVGLALIATMLAMAFKALTELLEIAVCAVARLLRGAVSGNGGLHGANQQNQFLGGARTTQQRNSRIRRCAPANQSVTMSRIFAAIDSLRPAA